MRGAHRAKHTSTHSTTGTHTTIHDPHFCPSPPQTFPHFPFFMFFLRNLARGPAYGNGDLCRRAGVGSGESFLKAGTGDNGRVRGIVLSRRATNFKEFFGIYLYPVCLLINLCILLVLRLKQQMIKYSFRLDFPSHRCSNVRSMLMKVTKWRKAIH